uniref:Uncharacterized protein n=1 Tax=Anguilla anguilla TaxID=7936 RepID=A0A0E9UGU6_ANGAN
MFKITLGPMFKITLRVS